MSRKSPDKAQCLRDASGSSWFDEEVKMLAGSLPQNDSDRMALLAESRAEFHTALSTFYAQVKYSTSIIFAILTAVFAILKISPPAEGEALLSSSVVLAVGLLLGAVLCLFFLVAAAGQYSLYLAAAIFSAKLHLACGIRGHPWFEWIEIYSRDPTKNDDGIIKCWMFTWTKRHTRGTNRTRIPSTFIAYAAVVLLLCAACLFGFIYFLMKALCGEVT
jgi:hypothetical protein